MPQLSRRFFLSGAAAAAALSGPAVAQTPYAQVPFPQVAFSSVSVDVSHLRAIGVGPFADVVEVAMTDELRRVFADRIVRRGRGPRLVVRVTGLFLVSLPAGQGFRGSSTDGMDGEALVVGARGEILARYPQHAALVPRGAWYDPLNEPRRAEDMARTYAQWLRRTVA
jgi:hypothetical protein